MFSIYRVALFCMVAATLSLPPAAHAEKEDTSKAEIDGLKSKFIDVGGVHTRYYEEGRGEPIVLIHGGFIAGSSTANVWSRNVHGLAKKYRVIAIDRRASGMSGNPVDDGKYDYNYQGDVEFIYDFIKTMKLGRVNLVGHSYGGAIAFFTAALHPDVVKTVTIVARGPANGYRGTRLDEPLAKCGDDASFEGMQCRARLLGWLPTTFDDAYWKADSYMAWLPKSVEARKKMAAGAGEPARTKDFPDWRANIWESVKKGDAVQMPVLMFGGKQDEMDWSKDEQSSSMKGLLSLHDIITTKNPNVKLIIYSNAGHFMYREYPDQFNADLSGFIDYWNSKGLK
jgi:2-hydroxy-6-oxonona-2,4-dienedioate hydrolase